MKVHAQERPSAYYGLTRAAARARTVTRGVLSAAACGLAITACGSQNLSSTASSITSAAASPGSTTTTSPSSASAVGECGTSQLRISLIDTGALAGQAGGYLKFTNDTGTACRMSGWPSVTGLTATGQATPLRRMQTSMFGAWHYTAPPAVLILKPGDAGYAIVAADDKPAGDNTRCPAPYERLRVSPPGDSGSVTISAWLPGAATYLPACTSADGSPTAGTSTITTLFSLPHLRLGRGRKDRTFPRKRLVRGFTRCFRGNAQGTSRTRTICSSVAAATGQPRPRALARGTVYPVDHDSAEPLDDRGMADGLLQRRPSRQGGK